MRFMSNSLQEPAHSAFYRLLPGLLVKRPPKIKREGIAHVLFFILGGHTGERLRLEKWWQNQYPHSKERLIHPSTPFA